jgi:hypothetical protein
MQVIEIQTWKQASTQAKKQANPARNLTLTIYFIAFVINLVARRDL